MSVLIALTEKTLSTFIFKLLVPNLRDFRLSQRRIRRLLS